MPKNPHPPRAAGDAKKSKKADDATKAPAAAEPSGKSKGKGKAKAKDATEAAPPPAEEPPKKPDTRTLIGGASWTGKLPVNMLSEHCQKQKWHKPDYSMVSRRVGTRAAP